MKCGGNRHFFFHFPAPPPLGFVFGTTKKKSLSSRATREPPDRSRNSCKSDSSATPVGLEMKMDDTWPTRFFDWLS
jgi:hypothetical protein